ncbi:MAG TPA: NAD-dependent epimerase/dehydratase family protein [Bacteroidales bacterium]|nr:NAD-dependent epimerase/dehydratase family protein [Bacteroidales bacterium]
MILVTGGTGFLGAHLLLELCEQVKKVRALKRPSSDVDFIRIVFTFYGKGALYERIEWVDGDICDIHSLITAMQDVDLVYHCAATVTFSDKDSKKLMKNNVQGTANIVDAALESGVRKLCHVSSIAVLGKAEVMSDDTLWDAREKHSKYAESKYQAELEVWRGVAEGLDAFVIRPSVILGPWKQTNGISVLFRKIENGLPYYAPGATAYVDVRDVARAMTGLMESHVKNDGFIASAENLSYQQFFNMVAETLGKPAPGRCAGRFMTGMAWRFFAIKDFFTGKDSGFNKTTAAISRSISKYSNNKLTETLSFSYIPIKESLFNIYRFNQFLSDKNHEKNN